MLTCMFMFVFMYMFMFIFKLMFMFFFMTIMIPLTAQIYYHRVIANLSITILT
jgi:hypothetical protein